MKRRQIKLMLLLLLFFKLSFSSTVENYQDELEVIPIRLSVNNLELEEPIMAYFNQDGLEPLIDLDEFLNKVSIKIFNYKKNFLDYQLNGEDRKVKLEIDNYGDKKLVTLKELKKILKETKANWDMSVMELDMVTEDELPWEFEKKQEESRENLKKKKGVKTKLYVGKMHFFTPGTLRISYLKSNLKTTKGNYLSLRTSNQILYGNLVQSTSITDDKISLNNFSWSRELYDNRKISIGDDYVNLPQSMESDLAYRGVKIYSKNSWGGAGLDVKENSIEGVVQDGLMVELYENGILKDYQVSKSSKFNFEVPSTSGINKYEVWIYNPDGTIKKDKISLHGDQNNLRRNEFDYEGEIGKSKGEKKFNPYNLNLRYGLTNNITIGLETYNIKNKKISEKKFNNYSLAYENTSLDFLTNKFEINYSQNIKNKSENLYRWKLISNSKLINNTFGVKNYKNLDEKLRFGDYNKHLYDYINFNLLRTSVSLGYEHSSKENVKDRKTYQTNLSRSFFRENMINTNLSYSKSYYSDKDQTQELEMRVSHDLDGKVIRKYMNTLVFSYKTDLERPSFDTYSIMFGKKKTKETNFNYYTFINISEKSSLIGVTFNYTFGGKISATSSSSSSLNNRDNISSSVGANATVDFESPEILVDPNNYGDSSIHGIAYIDANDNNTYDFGEEKVSGVKLGSASKGYSTKKDGSFYVPNLSSLSSKKLDIKIENDEYLGGYNIEDKINFETYPGDSLEINLPIKQIKMVMGEFRFSEKFYLEDVNNFLRGSELYITNVKTGKVTVIKVEDEYFITKLTQGEYTLEVKNKHSKKGEGTNKKEAFTINSDGDGEKYITLFIDKGPKDKGFIIKLK